MLIMDAADFVHMEFCPPLKARMIAHIDGVLCCGNVCYDIPVWPVESVAWGKSVWVDEITFSVGGNGANTAYALATLGAPVRLTGSVGRDLQGDALVEMLGSSGVNLDLHRSDTPTTSTVVLVQPSGDRSFVHRPGSSRDVTPDMLSYGIPGFSHFHLANPFSLPNIRTAAGQVMASAKQAGLTTSLDTAWDAKGRWMQDIGPALQSTDLLFVNDSEAEMLTGTANLTDAVRILREHGARDVVVKVGSRGCIVFEGSTMHEAPGFVVTAKDSTGAGDCFVGAFLATLHRRRNYMEAARIANAAGALNVQQLGAAKGMRSWEDTQAWIRDQDAR